MIDVGIITGSGIYELPGDRESRVVENRFGKVEVSVFSAGPWTVGSISRHERNHRHLPHTIPHQATSRPGATRGAGGSRHDGRGNGGPSRASGAARPVRRPLLSDQPPPQRRRMHRLHRTRRPDPRSPHMGRTFRPAPRRRLELATKNLRLEATVGGVYGHTNGPRFESRAEIRWLGAAGVTAVSQTCGPEAVLAGDWSLPTRW
jgi:purine nucleoside phosphorylase